MEGALPNKPLRVAMVIDTYDDARNGAVISTQRFTRLLRDKGHTVTVVTTGRPEPGKLLMKEFYPPFPFIKGIMQRMKFIFGWPDIPKISELLRETDVLHNHMPFLLSIRSISLARKAGVPVVSTFHVQAEQVVKNAGLNSRFLVKLVYRVFMRFIYNRSDLVICPSPFAADEIKRYGCTAPTVVISNGVTPDYRILDNAKKIPDKFVILTVGRNATEKRQAMIIEAVARSRYKDQIKLYIIGDGPLRAQLEAMNRDLLNGEAEFHYLPPAELIGYYNIADLYVHAAEVEVECMTALEAMACGVPLLIADSELSATKQFALGPECLYHSPEELTQKIEHWIENREALAQKRDEYFEFVRHYRIEESYQKLESAYRRAIAQKKG